MEPVFTENITVTVMDYDFMERNDRIGVVKVNYKKIKQEGHRKMRWYHIYGAPEGHQKGYARKMNKGLVEGSNYRGEILMEFSVKKTETKATMKRFPIDYTVDIDDNKLDDEEIKSMWTKEVDYYLRADIYEGTEINDIKGITTGDICVQVHVADTWGESRPRAVKDKNVFVEWYETLSSHKLQRQKKKDIDSSGYSGGEVREHLIGPFKIPEEGIYDRSYPLPDVFIYLCAKELTSKQMKQVSYYRVPLRQILTSGLILSIFEKYLAIYVVVLLVFVGN